MSHHPVNVSVIIDVNPSNVGHMAVVVASRAVRNGRWSPRVASSFVNSINQMIASGNVAGAIVRVRSAHIQSR